MRVGDGTVAVETYFFPSWWAGNKLCVPKHFGQWSSWTAFNVSGGVSVSAALQVNQTCLGPNQVSNLTFYCANTSHINYLLTYQCVAIRLQYLSHRWFSQCLLKHTDQQMEASFNFFYMIVHAGWLVCVCVWVPLHVYVHVFSPSWESGLWVRGRIRGADRGRVSGIRPAGWTVSHQPSIISSIDKHNNLKNL